MMLPQFGARAEMERVSLSRPCPVCKKPDWCLVAPDGQAAICSRVESPKRSGEAGWLHRLSESVPPTSQKQVAARDWQAEATNFAARLDDSRRSKLAAHLNLPSDSLAVLSLLGYSSGTNQPFFTFPECDEHGIVIGLNRRFEDDSKRMMPGGRRGITLPTGWQDKPGQLLIVEGPTDTVALIAA